MPEDGHMTEPTGEAARVLLIEDDAQLSAMLVRLLGDEGYQVDTARDGQQGLHQCLSQRFDVLVLDRGLAVAGCLELLRTLRQGGVTTPVLVRAGGGKSADRVGGVDAGAEDYLAKPCDVEELFARLRALRRRHLDAA